MIESSCHCGAVTLRIAYAPEDVTLCNCSVCRRYGALWAYYSPGDVEIAAKAALDEYAWGDDPTIVFYRCGACGCVSHWSSIDQSRDRMGVNTRLMSPAVLAQATVHLLDRAD